jgi:hypothetical protein
MLVLLLHISGSDKRIFKQVSEQRHRVCGNNFPELARNSQRNNLYLEHSLSLYILAPPKPELLLEPLQRSF